MTRARSPITHTPARTGGEERPEPACAGRWDIYDVLIDQARGEWTRGVIREARVICGSCPLQQACLTANRDEQWAQLILGIDTRNAPVLRQKCGTRAGAEAHRKSAERPCGRCKEAERKRYHARKYPAPCGSDSGYYRHTRTLREKACDDCRAAHSAAQRAREGRRLA